jgi:hypothetical protein
VLAIRLSSIKFFFLRGLFTMRFSIFWLAPYAAAQTWTSLPGALYGPGQPWGNAFDASWPPSSVGQPLIPQKPDAETQAMINQVSADRVKNIVTTLANFGTRHTMSSQNDTKRGIGAARDWIYQEMLNNAKPSNGSMEVFFNSYIQPVSSLILFPTNITNVVARVNGTTDPNRVYVVTGHYDSRRIDIMDYTNDAPGADDDATGVAGMLKVGQLVID